MAAGVILLFGRNAVDYMTQYEQVLTNAAKINYIKTEVAEQPDR